MMSVIVAILCLLSVNSFSISDVTFTKPEQIYSKDYANHIVLGMIIMNIKSNSTTSDLFMEDIDKMVESLLSWSSGTPLCLIVITDEKSAQGANKVIANALSKFVSVSIIRNRSKNLHIPRVKLIFVSIAAVAEGSDDFLAALKHHADTTNKQGDILGAKYSNDLFYLGPVYHRKFLNLERMIFLDVDLLFQCDVKDLENQFSQLGDSCLGVGLDLSPHYLAQLQEYRQENPNTMIGKPGKSQGFNTGVMLYNLQCLRSTDLYNQYLNTDRVFSLITHYKMSITLGDQDWFTMLGWKEPSLFHILPCQFNLQTSMQYLVMGDYREVFHHYHSCVSPSQAMVIHRNGCGPTGELSEARKSWCGGN